MNTENNNSSTDDFLSNFLDTERWLLQFGVLTGTLESDLVIYGYVCHKYAVNHVVVDIDTEKKKIVYTLSLSSSVYKAHNKYLKLLDNNTIFSLLKARFLLKRFGNLSFDKILSKAIRARCGKDWTVEVITNEYKQKARGFRFFF